MKLEAWLRASEISDADFAERIGVSRQALWRYKSGTRVPRPAIINKIAAATNHKVAPADFFISKEPASNGEEVA